MFRVNFFIKLQKIFPAPPHGYITDKRESRQEKISGGFFGGGGRGRRLDVPNKKCKLFKNLHFRAGTDVVIQSATEEEEEDGARVELESKSASSTSRTQKRLMLK